MRFFIAFMVAAGFSGSAYGQDLTDRHIDARPAVRHDLATHQLKWVFVQIDAGKELAGRFLQVDSDTLSLLIDGRRIDLPLGRVHTIQAAGDSIDDGARIGALALGLWSAFVYRRADIGSWSVFVALNASVGAAVGAGIDAADRGRTTIYRAGASGATSAPARPHAQLSFRF